MFTMEYLIETKINHQRRPLDVYRRVVRLAAFIFIMFITLLIYQFQSQTFEPTFSLSKNYTNNTRKPFSDYPFHPSIWTMGMFNQHSLQSLCDYKKTSLANKMFWNELLFDEQVWIIDNNPEYIRRAQTNYQYIYPHPKFYVSKPSIHVLNRMERINNHTNMRTPAYELQQWSTFYFDIYAKKVANIYSIVKPQILAIVDADSQLLTFPTFESVFPEMSFYNISNSNRSINQKMKQFKLRAFGIRMDLFSEVTELLLRKPQVANFMITFPIYVYLDTLKNMRTYVQKLHNMSFDAAFEKSILKSKTYYSQFAIILTYAYWFERERYSFYIQSWPETKLMKSHSDLPPSSIPQPRVSIHIKANPKQAIMKGCCFSYQLKDIIMNTSLYFVFTYVNRTRIKDLCNSFGNYENHYEATCEDWRQPNDDDKYCWKQADTMTKHYKAVARDIQYLTPESRNKKIMACINYLNDLNAHLWFPSSDACVLL
jgi:hypothetical protein